MKTWKDLLVEWYEAWCDLICGKMSYFPVGEDWELEVKWHVKAFYYSWVEMGSGHDGFMIILLKTHWEMDAIWVIVDCLMKSAHFLPFKTTVDVVFMGIQYI